MNTLTCFASNLRQIEQAVTEKFNGIVSDESREATRIMQLAYAEVISEQEANARVAAILKAWRNRRGLDS